MIVIFISSKLVYMWLVYSLFYHLYQVKHLDPLVFHYCFMLCELCLGTYRKKTNTLVFQNDLSMTICVKREAGVETVSFLSL